VKTRGPYAVVRHPVYASYLLIQSGYVLQAMSLHTIAVFMGRKASLPAGTPARPGAEVPGAGAATSERPGGPRAWCRDNLRPGH